LSALPKQKWLFSNNRKYRYSGLLKLRETQTADYFIVASFWFDAAEFFSDFIKVLGADNT